MARALRLKLALSILACCFCAAAASADGETQPGRDPRQPIDEAYTAKMKKYTTEPFFTSPLVDYLPASKTFPTPEAVLGDVAGASETEEIAESGAVAENVAKLGMNRAAALTVAPRRRND